MSKGLQVALVVALVVTTVSTGYLTLQVRDLSARAELAEQRVDNLLRPPEPRLRQGSQIVLPRIGGSEID